MSVAKILRAAGATEKITNELAQFRELFYQRASLFVCEGAFFNNFLLLQSPVENLPGALADFFRAEATTRCVVSDSELAFVNLSTPEIVAYYNNIRILLSAIEFPFVFLREYTHNQPVEPSPCDEFRQTLGIFLRGYTDFMTSMRSLCTQFSFHALGRIDVMWDGESLGTLQALFDRVAADTAALAGAFMVILQDLA